jgi:hypothetical protein
MLKGRKEEALHNLARLHARGDINDAFVQAEYAELDAKVSAEAQISSGWVEVCHSLETVSLPTLIGLHTRSSEGLPIFDEFSLALSCNSQSK